MSCQTTHDHRSHSIQGTDSNLRVSRTKIEVKTLISKSSENV